MPDWTDEARRELEAYLAEARAAVRPGEGDPDEVADDLRRHVEEEFRASGTTTVTADDVRRIVARLGLPERRREPPAGPAAGAPPDLPPPLTGHPRATGGYWRWLGLTYTSLFGIALPLVALAVESVTHMCADTFFEPLYTLLHAALAALVPLAALAGLLALGREPPAAGRWLGWLLGAALGSACYFSVLFLPLAPLALFAIACFGLGLLPLAPLLALFAVLLLRAKYQRAAFPTGKPRLWPGALLALLLLLGAETPRAATLLGLSLARSEKPATRQRGLRLLRLAGDRQMLLRNCYSAGFGQTADESRRLYYLVTGTPFNDLPAPRLNGNFLAADWPDGEVGREDVGGRSAGLALAESRLDASLDADAGLAYLEWTMSFANRSAWDQEARAQVNLPSGAIVSRLTLWVNGEEREAVFAARAQTRAAYQGVVQRRRDPALVTTCGPDRVLVQCFPVPAQGLLKLRLGLTAPLLLADAGAGNLRLPFFLERNFDIAPDRRHAVWLEGRRELAAPGLAGLEAERAAEGCFALRGELTDEALAGGAAVRAARDPALRVAWTPDPRPDKPATIRQEISAVPGPAYARLIFVADGSARMIEYAAGLAEALGGLATPGEAGLVLAGDQAVEAVPPAPATPEHARRLAETLRGWRFAGGCDNTPALRLAWDRAAAAAPGAIVWLHAGQPLDFPGLDALRQAFERRPDGPVLYDLQLGGGGNLLLRALDDLPAVRGIERLSGGAADLARLLDLLGGRRRELVFRRERLPGAAAAEGHRTSDHLFRLWAAGEAQALQAAGRGGEAVALAADCRLVTPLTGAVVLETAEQYRQAGLEPAAPDRVPAIPEPELWLLLAAAAALLLLWGCAPRPAATPGRRAAA